MTYRGVFTTNHSARRMVLEMLRFAGSVITGDLDGVRAATIALPPNMLDLGILEGGTVYRVDVTCFGDRENSFGKLHLPDECTRWFAPNASRSKHDWWTEGYNLRLWADAGT